MNSFYKLTYLLLMLMLTVSYVYSQNYSISGTIKNSETGEPVAGADVTLTPGTGRTMSGADGTYSFKNLSTGKYIIKAVYIGYTTETKEVVVSNSDITADFNLKSGSISTEELIIEINRAKIRETPVAFSDIDSKSINQKIHGQDAPLIVKGVPGLYSYSTDGVGNGEGQLLIRGFSQNYVQVLINGIPTNDPESNAVYWSNWGSVSSNAGSIQIQRGAGSSLYGSGSFGGSFNVLTENPGLEHFYGLNMTLGDPKNIMYGLKLNTGLIKKKLSFTLNVERKIAEGSRISGRYEGINYYTSISYFASPKHTLKIVLHGAPQEHGYSFSNNVVYFMKYGFKSNSAPFLTKSVVDQLPNNKTNGLPNYGLNDGSRELVDNNFVNLSHNFFHKPQAELHYIFDVNNNSKFLATLFYSLGRGGGSSITGNGTIFSLQNRNKFSGTNGHRVDTLTTNYYGSEGYVNTLGVADTIYLKNAVQRISYSFHRQFGILTSYQTQLSKNFNITGGAEFRSWYADHPGHYTNMFGKTRITQSYAATDTVNKIVTFNRYVYQGDLKGPDGDIGNIFSWGLSENDPAYKTQYRNYIGETPQLTIFAQGNYVWNKLNFMGSIQYVWYKYKLTENMPSENGIGRQLTTSEASNLGLTDSTSEGLKNGKFYMYGSNKKFYEFNLVNEARSRGFIQPKFGVNFNATKNLNLFANFSHVERFIDLGIFYNQGRVFPGAEDEKSDQFEAGLGWNSDWINAKINGYYMLWDNKSARIQDITKAGEPGYDRNGFRSELVGKSSHMGIEFEFSSKLDKFLPLKGLGLKGSTTFMDNKWTKILDAVKYSDSSGVQVKRAFNTTAYDENGNPYIQYFTDLENKHVASGPQMLFNLGLNYDRKGLFAGVDMNYFAKFFLLDGETYLPVKSEFVGLTNAGKEIWNSEYGNKMPAKFTFDAYAGYDFKFKKFLNGTISVQVLNIADTDYFSASDRFGLIPGAKRTYRFNISLGY
jgi:outer membrane receptor protein involved in Fe transport